MTARPSSSASESMGALWSASGYVSAFMRASNRVLRDARGPADLEDHPVRLGVTLFTVICLLLGIVIVVVTGTIADQVGSALGSAPRRCTVWDIVKWPVLLLIVVLMRRCSTTPRPTPGTAASDGSRRAPG